jgi:hypothetical protein
MLVGICGKAGAGKDTIGDHLISEYGFEKIAFADPIKRLVKDVFVLDDHTVYDRIAREEPLEQWGDRSVRELLQFIGTGLFREQVDPDIWVKSLWFRIQDSDKNYVITDLRFPNEIESLSEYGTDNFTSIKVKRKGCNGEVGLAKNMHPIKKLFYKLIRKDLRHPSERYDLVAQHTFENNDTIEDLHGKVDSLMDTLGMKRDTTTKIEKKLSGEIIYSHTDCSKNGWIKDE